MLDATLAEIRELTPNVLQFTLNSEMPLPEAVPGAHIDLHLPDGTIRQYSLISPLCTTRSYVIAVKRENPGRGGSAWLHGHARTGTRLLISAPRNHFALEESTAPMLLIAGGIGITPIYAMFQHLRERGGNVELHYWCGGPEETLFLETLRSLPETRLHYPSQTRVTAGAVVATAPAGAQIYCCGPSRMLQDCEAALRPDCNLRAERFMAAPIPAEGGAFTVKLAQSGQEISVGEDETILSALLAAGLDVAYSCEEGVCGACETIVLEGEPVHMDSVRAPAEHARLRSIMICCSRSQSPFLTLDL